MTSLPRELLFSLLIAVFSIILAFMDFSDVPDAHKGIHDRGGVVAVDNSDVRVNLIVKTGIQQLSVQLQGGPCKGENVEVVNRLTGTLELDEFYEPGDTILVEYDMRDGKAVNAVARGHYRLRLEFALIGLFALLLLTVAGVTGIKAILSFIFSALVLWKLFFPLLLKGYPPVAAGLLIVTILTAVICFSVGGLTRRGVATFLGAMLGELLTCVLAMLFVREFHLHGAVRPFAEMLLYSGYYELNLIDIFSASIFVACSGAVMDLSMDIAATMHELKCQQPRIGVFEHMRSGLRVGQAVTGTMTTTLLLAYSASHMCMFMVFLAKGLSPENLLNAPFVAAEILNILVGSFGVVAVAPCTVLISALIYRTWTPREETSGGCIDRGK
jgi:uncharacterized membrane protein